MFTVISYNVLAQNLLEDHLSMYRATDQEHLDWKYRSLNLLKELQAADADVCDCIYFRCRKCAFIMHNVATSFGLFQKLSFGIGVQQNVCMSPPPHRDILKS